MKDLFDRLKSPRWPVIFYFLVGLVAAVLLLWRLGTLLPGWSQAELTSRAAANSIHKLIGNPINLPYKLLQYGLLRLGRYGLFWMRLVSVLFGALMVAGFYQILRTWYSSRIAVLCSFLFLTSAWFLHYARLGTPNILLGGAFALIWVGIQLRSNAPRFLTLLIGAVITLALLYVPGMVWIIGALLFWQRHIVRKDFIKLPLTRKVILIIGLIIGLAPLLHGLIRHPALIRVWLGLPTVWSPTVLLSNLWHLPVWLVLQGPTMPIYWLGHVPLLDVFSVAMLGLGVYVFSRHIALDRIRTMILILVVGAVLTVLNGPTWLFMVAPVLYLTVAAGVALLLQQWFTVFPRNPLARTVGIIMVTSIVLLASFYNLHHYFIAWPNNGVTKVLFSLRS